MLKTPCSTEVRILSRSLRSVSQGADIARTWFENWQILSLNRLVYNVATATTSTQKQQVLVVKRIACCPENEFKLEQAISAKATGTRAKQSFDGNRESCFKKLKLYRLMFEFQDTAEENSKRRWDPTIRSILFQFVQFKGFLSVSKWITSGKETQKEWQLRNYKLS